MISSLYGTRVFRGRIRGVWYLGLGAGGPYYVRKQHLSNILPDNLLMESP